MKSLRLIVSIVASSLVLSTLIATPAHADDGRVSIVTGIQNLKVSLSDYAGDTERVNIDATWDAPVASDGSKPYVYMVSMSPSATDPDAAGSRSMLGAYDTKVHTWSYGFGPNGTYYLWVRASYSTLTTSASAPMEYKHPVTYVPVTIKAPTPSLDVVNKNTLAARWNGITEQPDMTMQLKGADGSLRTWHTTSDAYSDQSLNSHSFSNLPEGSYSLRIKQIGVDSSNITSTGTMVSVYTYTWSDWSKATYLATPAVPKNVKLKVKYGSGNTYTASFKRPSARGGYSPILYRIQLQNRNQPRGATPWYLWSEVPQPVWSKASGTLNLKWGTKYLGYVKYRVRVQACHTGNFNYYRHAEPPLLVCSAYSAWSNVAVVNPKNKVVHSS